MGQRHGWLLMYLCVFGDVRCVVCFFLSLLVLFLVRSLRARPLPSVYSLPGCSTSPFLSLCSQLPVIFSCSLLSVLALPSTYVSCIKTIRSDLLVRLSSVLNLLRACYPASPSTPDQNPYSNPPSPSPQPSPKPLTPARPSPPSPSSRPALHIHRLRPLHRGSLQRG